MTLLAGMNEQTLRDQSSGTIEDRFEKRSSPQGLKESSSWCMRKKSCNQIGDSGEEKEGNRERDSPRGLISIGDGSRCEWGQGWYKRGPVASVEHQSSNPRNSSNHEGIHGELNLSHLLTDLFLSTSSSCPITLVLSYLHRGFSIRFVRNLDLSRAPSSWIFLKTVPGTV